MRSSSTLRKSLVGITCALAACSAPPASRPSAPPSPSSSAAAVPSTPAAPGADPATQPSPAAPSPAPAPRDAAPPAPSKLIKLDSDGIEITGMGFDANHALYVAGEFRGQLELGSASLRSAASDPRAQIFLARLHPHGDVDWLIRVGAPHPAGLDGISVAPDGTVALAGLYTWPIGTERGHTASYQLEAFVILVGADGKVRWERRIDGKERQMANAVHVTADGAVLVGGSFEDATRFGPSHRATSVPGPHVASVDFFLARFSPAGDVEWVATGGGPEDDGIKGLTIAANGDIIAVGDLGRDAVIGESPHAIRLPGAPAQSRSANPFRSFVASYSPSGALRWATEAASTKEWSMATAPHALPDGSVLAHGWEQDLSAGRTGFLAHVDARGKLLHHRTLPELGGATTDAAGILSARAAGSTIVFERHTGTTTSPEGPNPTFSGAGLAVTALARSSDGRIAVAGTIGEPTRTQISHDTSSVSHENIDGYIALAPSIGALRTR